MYTSKLYRKKWGGGGEGGGGGGVEKLKLKK